MGGLNIREMVEARGHPCILFTLVQSFFSPPPETSPKFKTAISVICHCNFVNVKESQISLIESTSDTHFQTTK